MCYNGNREAMMPWTWQSGTEINHTDRETEGVWEDEMIHRDTATKTHTHTQKSRHKLRAAIKMVHLRHKVSWCANTVGITQCPSMKLMLWFKTEQEAVRGLEGRWRRRTGLRSFGNGEVGVVTEGGQGRGGGPLACLCLSPVSCLLCQRLGNVVSGLFIPTKIQWFSLVMHNADFWVLMWGHRRVDCHWAWQKHSRNLHTATL